MLVLSQILLLITVLGVIFKKKIFKKRKVKTVYIIVFGIFLSVLAANAFIDTNAHTYIENEGIFLCVLHSLQVMLAGFEFDGLYEKSTFDAYTYVYLSFLFSVAPVCTFSFVLSFFERFTAWVKCIFKRRANIYVISGEGDKAAVLAESVRKSDAKALIIFACRKDAVVDIKSTGAVFFDKNIKNISLSFASKKSRISFFIMGDDEQNNLEETLALIEKFKGREKTELYVLSSSKVGGLLVDSADKGIMKVRRVNEWLQLAYSEIDNSDKNKTLIPKENKGKISVLIIGMGGIGCEFLKSSLWCGQLPYYELEINVVDKKENIKSVFYEMCPEIIEKNGNKEEGESKYTLNFYQGVDVNTHEFEEIIATLPDTTLVLVSLGSDDINIETAIMLRTQMTRMRIHPVIKAVVCSNEKNKLLSGKNLTNYKKQNYDIMFIGDIDTCFSYERITNKKMEKMALAHHLAYYELTAKKRAEQESGDYIKIWEEEKEKALTAFNGYEYFRNSSAATNVYRTYFKGNDYNDDEKKILSLYEHMRWNTYMRTEGYVYGKERNDLAKTHPDLVWYNELSKEDVDKDMKMVEIK